MKHVDDVRLLTTAIAENLGIAEAQLSAYMGDRNPDRLHVLRVAIKKARALYAFLIYVTEQKKEGRILRALFRSAGVIREITVTTNLLQTIPDIPQEVFDDLQTQRFHAEDRLCAKAEEYLSEVRKLRRSDAFPPMAVSKKRPRKFIRKKIREAETALKDGSRPQMHKFRIAVKSVMYLYAVLPSSLREVWTFDMAQIDAFQAKAGDWHDSLMALEHLSAYSQELRLNTPLAALTVREQRQFAVLQRAAPALLAAMTGN